MLINEPQMKRVDPILSMIAAINGNSEKQENVRTGVYMIGHFGSSNFMRGYNDYPHFDEIGSYGVCDSIENLLEKAPELENDPDRKFVVCLTSVKKANQSPDGGWRWHKWGEYIGKHEPQHEYLYYEKDIDEVFVYHIYEKE